MTKKKQMMWYVTNSRIEGVYVAIVKADSNLVDPKKKEWESVDGSFCGREGVDVFPDKMSAMRKVRVMLVAFCSGLRDMLDKADSRLREVDLCIAKIEKGGPKE